MKKLETQTGYYRNGDIFSKIVCLPDNTNADDWKLVSDEEYNEWMASQPKEEEAYQWATANGHFASIEKEQ